MRLRIVTSIVLMIGFYLLAVTIAFALLAAIYASVRHGHIYPRFIIFGGATAAMILWSILPRIDRFAAPGPQLTHDVQPELFDVIRGVARDSGEAMPADVYLIPNVNAFVSYRGGMMGVGSRRVMGIGLPLLQTLSVSQLRAVIAHEFGHYAGGDLNLGGRIYKTRAAMARTIENVGRVSSWVHAPFVAYGNLFMRVTQAIGRAQEIAADRMAVRVAGARSHASALRIVHGVASAFDSYWMTEVVPVLTSGYRPPIGAGFARFISAAPVAKAIDSTLAEDMNAAADPYDSHPSLKERLAAIGDIPDVSPLRDDPPAISLIRDLPQLELELLRTVTTDKQQADALKTIDWDDAPMRIYVPSWRERRAELGDSIANATAADVPSLVVKLAKSRGEADARGALCCAVSAKLVDEGWTCATSPGEPIVFAKDGRTFEPFKAAMDAAEWESAVRAAGIEEMRIG